MIEDQTSFKNIKELNDLNHIAHFYLNNKNYNESFKYFKLSAENGNSNSQYNIGLFYLNGIEIEQNFEEAIKWFKISIENGEKNGIFELKKLIFNNKNLNSFNSLKILSDFNNSLAQYKLGKIYHYKYNNINESIKFYKLSYNNGYLKAKKNINF